MENIKFPLLKLPLKLQQRIIDLLIIPNLEVWDPSLEENAIDRLPYISYAFGRNVCLRSLRKAAKSIEPRWKELNDSLTRLNARRGDSQEDFQEHVRISRSVHQNPLTGVQWELVTSLETIRIFDVQVQKAIRTIEVQEVHPIDSQLLLETC